MLQVPNVRRRCAEGRTDADNVEIGVGVNHPPSPSPLVIMSSWATHSTSSTPSAPSGSPGTRTYYLKHEAVLLELA